MKKIYAFTLVFILILLSACSGQQSSNSSGSSSAKSGDVIKVGLDVDAGTLDPRLAKDTTAGRIDELVFDGLVQLDENLKPKPALAESWDNPDKKTWVFHLRKGVKFQDGSDLTAEDVKYTYDTVLDKNFKAPYRSLYTSIKSIEVVDDQTVKINLKEPYAPLLSYLDLGIVPKGAADKKDFASNPIGTGPYKVKDWSKNNKIELVANDKFWGDQPKTANITFYIIPDNSTRAAALESGDVDLIHSPVSPQDVKRLKQDDRFVVKEASGLGFTYLNFNTKDPILSDVKVRQAIAHLVNKESISKNIYQDMDRPGVSPLLPSSWAYSEKITDLAYDPEKAKQILDEAGWKDTDGDGIRDKDGKKLSIELSTHTEDPNRMQAITFIQNELSKAGFEANVKTTEWPTFSDNLLHHKFDVALLGWLNLVDPDRAMYNPFHCDSGNNYGQYCKPKVDKLLEQGRATMDQDQRAKLYQQAAQIVTNEVAYDVLLYQGYVVMYTKDLKGFELHPSGDLRGLMYATK